MKSTYLLGAILLGMLALLPACHKDDLSPKENRKTEKEPEKLIPDGFEPCVVDLGGNSTRASMVKSTPVFGNTENGIEGNTRAIVANEEHGKLIFTFDEVKESQNLIVILRQKGTDNIIYLSDVKYQGNSNSRFKIIPQKAKGCKKIGISNFSKDNFKNWYAMFIYDNPNRVHPDRLNGQLKHGHSYVNGNGIKMPVGSWYASSSKEGYISSIALNGKGKAIDKAVDIPFASNWIPMAMDDENRIVAKEEVALHPQGVLLRVEVSNQSSFPVTMRELIFETNILHPNIEYDLTLENLPSIEDKNANANLKWHGIEGDATKNMASKVMMGNSFVGGIDYYKDPELSKILMGKSTEYPKGQKLDAYFYIWGMPKTKEEIDNLGNGNIPMTAFYTKPTVVKTARTIHKYTTSDEEDFDEKVLQGVTPAPLLTSNISMASKATISGKNGTIIPVPIIIKDRPASPIERFCRYHALKPTTPDKPRFSKTNKWVEIDRQETSKHGQICYFDYTDITSTQPNGSKDIYNYRILGTAAGDGKRHPIPGYHIPNVYEVQSILPTKNLQVGDNPNWKPSVQGAHILQNEQWIDESFYIYGQGRFNQCVSYYRKVDAKQTAIIAGKPQGAIANYILALRGLKGSTSDTKVGYTEAMGLYLYSVGNNELYIEYIPLTEQWITRFDGNREAFKNEILSKNFWDFFREPRLFRSVAYIYNYPQQNIYSFYYDNAGKKKEGWESLWGSMLWMSGDDDKDFDNYSLCWGVEADHKGKQYWISGHYNLSFHNALVFSHLQNVYRNKNADYGRKYKKGTCIKYGVHLVYDKLW